MTGNPTEAFSPRKSLKIALGWLSPRRKTQLLLMLGLSLLGAFAELATLGAVLPFIALLADPDAALTFPLIGALFANLGWAGGTSLIVPVTLLFGGIVLTAAGIRLALVWATTRFSQALGHDLAVRVFGRTLHQPYTYHTSRNTSEVIAGVEKVGFVVNGVLTPALDVLVATIMAAAILAGLIAIDWVVALLAGGLFGLVYWVLSRVSTDLITRNSRVISASSSARVQSMQEGLGGIRDILLDGSQPLHLARFQTVDHSFRKALVSNTLWGQMPRYLVEALGIGIIAGLAVVTALKAGSLGEALPVLGALALGAQKLLPLFQRMYGGWTLVVGNQGNLEDVAELANTPIPEGTAVVADPRLAPFEKSLTLTEVGFRYREDAPWVIRGLDLEIPKGARVGFAGETGCGKSTLLDLIMGLLIPSEGDLKVDGMKLTPTNLRHWQARISHVPQSIFLSDASLKANIAFGETPDRIDAERVKEAARRARIHDFIETLDDGYETKVGERGIRLSGGQRQRVGIARALYRRADVLVLDEATSALDGETESSVMDGIAEVGRDITVLIVAHRLSTLTGCDVVVSRSSHGWVQEGRSTVPAGT